MRKETSKINIQKAQDSRRVIGVAKFLAKLRDYYDADGGLWAKICDTFSNYGFEIKVKEEKK